jgi:transcriptional regulator with XRE-family HTH domain
MPSRENPIHEAIRRAAWVRMQIGRELRIARISAGMTQRQVGHAIGRSASRISRIEAAKVSNISVLEWSKIAAAAGLKLHVTTYPTGRRPLDAPQLALLGDLNGRLHASWRRQLEATIPLPGDLRAVDELIRTDACSCAVEAFTRLADLQRQVRSSRTKQRDIGADRLILLVRASRANRRMLHEAEPFLQDGFPIGTRAALHALAAGKDPGGDCLILL